MGALQIPSVYLVYGRFLVHSVYIFVLNETFRMCHILEVQNIELLQQTLASKAY